ncbi:MAG: hypothetical protein KatS3mg053_1720 [Candidatus Roseilinea sp.]|nr:MAG: hypothetical protein KatS3mg053_1720 [Candidatus Roseilinea sp.]
MNGFLSNDHLLSGIFFQLGHHSDSAGMFSILAKARSAAV